MSKLQAYALQDAGLDTVDAQLELDLPVDGREYAAGAAILSALGLRVGPAADEQPRQGRGACERYGIEVAAVERLSIVPNAANRDYLRTKRDRMGHDLVVDATRPGSRA